jgi:hypothetical protein
LIAAAARPYRELFDHFIALTPDADAVARTQAELSGAWRTWTGETPQRTSAEDEA